MCTNKQKTYNLTTLWVKSINTHIYDIPILPIIHAVQSLDFVYVCEKNNRWQMDKYRLHVNMTIAYNKSANSKRQV